jgi:ribonuclease HI
MSTIPKEAYIDGSSKGFYGYFLLPENETFIIKENEEMTSNRAEWLALFALILDLPQEWKGKVYSDSLLIVNQFNGLFKIKDQEMKRLHDSCKELANLKKLILELIWLPREQNLFGKQLERELNKERKRRWERQGKLLRHCT